MDSAQSNSQPKAKTLYCVKIHTSLEAEDATVEMLSQVFGVTPSAFSPESSPHSLVSVYVSDFRNHLLADAEPCGSVPLTSKQLIIKIKRHLRACLQNIQASGLDVSPGIISIRTVRPQDWAESWKRHFKPLTIGDLLLIKPSWSRKTPRSGQHLMIMDPGLSFGTGQHPTTAYCLTRIVESYKSGKAKSFLDIGTGSGILAIAAAKLGFNPVVAIDNDAEAVAKAAENALSNSVNSAISFSCNNLSAWKPRRRFDLVCANLQSDLLIQEAKLIRQSVAHQGLLVVAGILASQFEDVQETYRKLGLDLIESVTSGEWRSGLLGSPL